MLLFRNTKFAKDPEKVKRYLCELDKELALRKEKITTCTPSNAFNAFSSVFLNVTDRFALLLQLGGEKRKQPKWFSNKLKNLKSKNNIAHRYWKGSNDNSWLEKFKRLRSSYEKQCSAAKDHFYLNKFKSCLGNKRQVYKLINDSSGKVMNKSKVPVLETVANSISQPKDQDNAIAFNNYFANVGFEISKHLGAENEPEFPRRQQSMFLFKFTNEDAKLVISNLDNKSSSGEDFVNLLVKMSAPVTIEYITFLINFSFPQELKKAKVFPLHKSGSKLDENNYRPISLLIVWSKVYEKIMFNRVYSYFERFSLFYHRQF